MNKDSVDLDVLPVFTSSDQKIEEIRGILGVKVKKITPAGQFFEIQNVDIETVVRHKAKQAFDQNGKNPILVEHTGLFISSLSGLPGAMSESYIKALGNNKICSLLKNQRQAVAKTTVGFYNGFHTFYWTGITKGKISLKPKGDNGFGWDSIFIPYGKSNSKGKTFGQMSLAEKNEFSMRRKALMKFKSFFSIQNSADIRKIVNLDFNESIDLFHRLFDKKNKSVLFDPEWKQGQVPTIEYPNYTKIMLDGREILSKANVGKLQLIPGCVSNGSYGSLENSLVIRLGVEPDLAGAHKLDAGIKSQGFELFSTYGDSILKYLRNYILPSIPVGNEDAFNILRASNAKFFDEALKMRTAYGEALYYNPGDWESPVKYVYNAFKKNRNDPETNSIFRTYVLPEIASVWVYLNQGITDFCKKKGGYFFVPVISLAELLAFLLKKLSGNDPEELKQFLYPYLSKKKKYALSDVVNNWAFLSFAMFPEKSKEAELHLKIMEYVLEINNYSHLVGKLRDPVDFNDLLIVFAKYKELLMNYSHNIENFRNLLKLKFPDEKISFTEIVCLKPGLKSRNFQIPHTPDPLMVFLQGKIDYPHEYQHNINQIAHAHCVSRQFLPKSIGLISIIDKNGIPLVSPENYSQLSPKENSDKMFTESVILKYFTLLFIYGYLGKNQDELINLWNSSLGGE